MCANSADQIQSQALVESLKLEARRKGKVNRECGKMAVDKQSKGKKKKEKKKEKGGVEEELQARQNFEPTESSDDEGINKFDEATKTWELGAMLGLTTPARNETIKAIAEIRRNA